MKERKINVFNMVLAAMFLAIALVLPFFTMQIKAIGKMLCPMHFPVLLCGFLCGPWYGLAVGVIAPLLRTLLFGMPVFFPSSVGMCFELGTYGLVAGLLYNAFSAKTGYICIKRVKELMAVHDYRQLLKKIGYIYLSLILAMIAGRIVWGVARVIFYGLGSSEFTWAMFIAGALTDSIPGIILQIIIVPPLVILLRNKMPNAKKEK